MPALPLIGAAYAFLALGFCLGFAASAVLAGPPATKQEQSNDPDQPTAAR